MVNATALELPPLWGEAIMFRSLLVPLDRSPLAEQALPLALSIARRAGAGLELVLVHGLYALEDPTCERLPYDPAADAAYRQQEQLYVEGTARWAAAASQVPVTSAVVSGLVADGILSRARLTRSDLIVMTSHARSGMGRFFLGSVTDEVIRRAAVPVLVVRPCEPSPALIPEPVSANVSVLLDGSALAEQSLEPAVELARLLEARCILVRVVESSSAQAEAEAYLESVAGRWRAQGPPIEVRVLLARHAVGAILEEAQAHPTDLIALTTHGRGGIRRLLLGSVTDKILRGSSAPVLVHPPQVAQGAS
jgi:nucleotide-binding universal stress UspA family protein